MVRNSDDKAVSGAYVYINGNDQPSVTANTDSKGRFSFKVCEGQVRISASSEAGYAQATAEAGDTNVVIVLSSNGRVVRSSPVRTSFKGNPLPDLSTVNLASDAAPAGKPVLLCLFDAAQRPSRHFVRQLEERNAALKQQNIVVLGIQAAITTDEIFNEWKSASPVSFPIGRVDEKSKNSKWGSNDSRLPMLILTDAKHQVIADGFSLEELDDQVKKLAK